MKQRKNHKSMTDEELEEKIMSRYNKENPQPRNLKERVEGELKKLA